MVQQLTHIIKSSPNLVRLLTIPYSTKFILGFLAAFSLDFQCHVSNVIGLLLLPFDISHLE